MGSPFLSLLTVNILAFEAAPEKAFCEFLKLLQLQLFLK